MDLYLKRTFPREEYTKGDLFILQGNCETRFCYTLEDTVREIEGQPVEKWKKYGDTAIPRGIYDVDYTFSNRFKKFTLLLKDVPGFTGIRIHSGNSVADTEGCILLGYESYRSQVLKSRIAVVDLEKIVVPEIKANKKVRIFIGIEPE